MGTYRQSPAQKKNKTKQKKTLVVLSGCDGDGLLSLTHLLKWTKKKPDLIQQR